MHCSNSRQFQKRNWLWYNINFTQFFKKIAIQARNSTQSQYWLVQFQTKNSHFKVWTVSLFVCFGFRLQSLTLVGKFLSVFKSVRICSKLFLNASSNKLCTFLLNLKLKKLCLRNLYMFSHSWHQKSHSIIVYKYRRFVIKSSSKPYC